MERPVLFWRQPADLPELGAARLKAKLDTGSGGTALHATDIVVDGGRVRFTLHPRPEEPDAKAACQAPVSDQRRVTSSNGQAELRPFIRTALSLGGLPPRSVEISLTSRPMLRFRMLIGREALAAWDVLVDPGATAAPFLR